MCCERICDLFYDLFKVGYDCQVLCQFMQEIFVVELDLFFTSFLLAGFKFERIWLVAALMLIDVLWAHSVFPVWKLAVCLRWFLSEISFWEVLPNSQSCGLRVWCILWGLHSRCVKYIYFIRFWCLWIWYEKQYTTFIRTYSFVYLHFLIAIIPVFCRFARCQHIFYKVDLCVPYSLYFHCI